MGTMATLKRVLARSKPVDQLCLVVSCAIFLEPLLSKWLCAAEVDVSTVENEAQVLNQEGVAAPVQSRQRRGEQVG